MKPKISICDHYLGNYDPLFIKKYFGLFDILDVKSLRIWLNPFSIYITVNLNLNISESYRYEQMWITDVVMEGVANIY